VTPRQQHRLSMKLVTNSNFLKPLFITLDHQTSRPAAADCQTRPCQRRRGRLFLRRLAFCEISVNNFIHFKKIQYSPPKNQDGPPTLCTFTPVQICNSAQNMQVAFYRLKGLAWLACPTHDFLTESTASPVCPIALRYPTYCVRSTASAVRSKVRQPSCKASR